MATVEDVKNPDVVKEDEDVKIDIANSNGTGEVVREKLITDADFEKAGGIEGLIKQNDVMVFSKSTCPFCIEVKETLKTMNAPFSYFEVDSSSNGKEALKALVEKTKQKTVPNVFIKGEHIGGCDTTKKLQLTGELQDKLNGIIIPEPAPDANCTSLDDLPAATYTSETRGKAVNPLFWFPNTVNNYVVRLVGLQVVAICIVGIIHREDTWAHWMMAFLLFDYICRFTVGATGSLLGCIAILAASPFPPQVKPGFPKQFAASCGICFTLPVVALYFTENYTAGAIVLGMLLGAASLEAFCDFCLGCVFFGLGIQFGLVPRYVYRVYNNSRQEAIESWNYMFISKNTPAPTEAVDGEGKIALRYKEKIEEWRIEDFNLIKHMQVTFFQMPLSIAGLAAAWKLASRHIGDVTLDAETAWFKVFSIIAAVVFGLMFCLYLARAVMYPKKCLKDWHNPGFANSFGAITITIMLFDYLAFDSVGSDIETGSQFGRVLWWIAAPTHLILTIAKFGEWIGRYYDQENYTAAFMFFPVGCLIASFTALVNPAVTYGNCEGFENCLDWDSSGELALLYFGIGFIMWIVIFAGTFSNAISDPMCDDRKRVTLWTWVTAPAVAALAWLVYQNQILAGARTVLLITDVPSIKLNRFEGGSDLLIVTHEFKILYFISVVLFCCLAWACLPHLNFFTGGQFSMANWGYVFPLDILAAAAAYYHMGINSRVSKDLQIIFLTLASVATGMAFCMTMAGIVKKKVFVPYQKWGPLSFMRLTHEAFRGGLPSFSKALKELDLSQPHTVFLFAKAYKTFRTIHREHAKHEDAVIFKAANDLFAGHGKKFADDHQHDFALFAKWDVLVVNLINKDIGDDVKSSSLSTLKDEIPPFIEHFLEHLNGEEMHMNPVPKKYFPIAKQIEVHRAVMAITDAKDWELIIPFIVVNLPRHGQRIRYIKTLIWASPERAQQIGAIIYRNVDAVMWQRLTPTLPDIIPRGESNYRKIY